MPVSEICEILGGVYGDAVSILERLELMWLQIYANYCTLHNF